MSDIEHDEQPKKQRRKHGFWWNLLWGCASLALTAIVALICVYVYMEAHLPDVSELKDIHLQVPLRIYDQSGDLIAQYGEKRRIPIQFQDIPKQLINAVLATEDARFYEHPGIDLIGIARAGVALIKSGRKEQGASTITMQVARNFYLSREKTFSRKIKEILLALKINRELSKDTVLTLYLNKIFFGNRAYGVGAAAAVYYGKPLQDLSLAQMAMLAGLPQSPSRNNPIRNPQAAKVRRNHVLERMLKLQLITQAQYQHAITEAITATYHHKMIKLYAPYIADMARSTMQSLYGNQTDEKGIKVITAIDAKLQRAAQQALQTGLIDYSLRHGYRGPEGKIQPNQLNNLPQALADYIKQKLLPIAVVTAVHEREVIVKTITDDTITIRWPGLSWAKKHLPDNKYAPPPRNAYQIVKPYDVVRIQKHNGNWRLAQWPEVQGALIAFNPNTGAVQALTGGFNYRKSAFNRATQAQRQPGSSFKPFIYSAALNQGYTLASIINDAPIVLKDSGENIWWRPTNDTHKFYGPTTLKTGLAHSRNLVSIRLLQKIGIDYTLHYLTRFGFNPESLPHSLSLALGSGVLTPYQLAHAYNVLANGGYLIPNYFIQSYSLSGTNMTDHEQTVICQPTTKVTSETEYSTTKDTPTEPKPTCAKQTITAQNDYLMTRALQAVIQTGTGRAAKALKRKDLAGKTGTTNKQLDAWFAGYNNQLVAIVWVGFDDQESLHEYGAKAALPIWIKFMKQALKGTKPASLQQPPGIVMVRINKKTGLPTDNNNRFATFEAFRSQYAPTEQTNTNDDAPSPLPTNASPPATAENTQDSPIF